MALMDHKHCRLEIQEDETFCNIVLDRNLQLSVTRVARRVAVSLNCLVNHVTLPTPAVHTWSDSCSAIVYHCHQNQQLSTSTNPRDFKHEDQKLN